jgi:enoyl-CoA hydratase/carnithine racemase
MLLAGRRLSAQECLERDIVMRIVEPPQLLDAAHDLLDRLSKMSAPALRLTKLVADVEAAEAHPFVDQLAQAVLVGDEVRDTRIRSFLNR